jgi:hypothetical protein
VSTDDPKPLTPEEREAAREEIAAKIIKTADMVARSLKGEKFPEGTFGHDPTTELYTRIEERAKAEAAVVEELIDIVLPEVKLLAKPIRSACTLEGEKRQQALLEDLFGSLAARQRQSEWLDVPGMHLAGSIENHGMFHGFQPNDSGATTGSNLLLLVDGRLVEVHLAGTWKSQGNMINEVTTVIVATRVVKAADVMRDYELVDIIMLLRNVLHDDLQVLKDRHVPDIAERQVRFDAIVTEYTKLVSQYSEQLRRVGDNPA